MSEIAGTKLVEDGENLPTQTYRRKGNNGNGFKQGHKKVGGRRKGTPNRFQADVRAALLDAVNRFGRDGQGEDAMVGFFLKMCDTVSISV